MIALAATPWLPVLALLIERLVGYPQALFHRMSHPVVWIGGLIEWLEGRLNRRDWRDEARRRAGVLALLIVLAITVGAAALLQAASSLLPFGWIGETLLAVPFLAQNHLRRAVAEVADNLATSLAAGRTAVGQLVGRDTAPLDEAGVARAAVESLAENTSDGVIAPLFWLILFGLPGIAAYKAVNTADSMIGHRSERYLHFGWASARLDDLFNLVPARLTALLFIAAAAVVGNDAKNAARAALRDAGKHLSPNAGWPEAAMAGALALQLGGPRLYEGQTVTLATMGSGRAELTGGDIRRAVRLYDVALWLDLFLTLALGAGAWLLGR